MHPDAAMMERHARLLGRFAEQAASLAEDLHGCALTAESVEEKRAISIAFHRMGRALRQTIALEAKLAHDSRRAEREIAAEVVSLESARASRRKARIESTVTRVIWQEAEDEDWVFARLGDLERFLAEDEAWDELPEDGVEAYIAKLCAELGLPSTAHPGEGGDPPPNVIPRSGGTPDPWDPSGAPGPDTPLGSHASPCGRAWDDVGLGGDMSFDASG